MPQDLRKDGHGGSMIETLDPHLIADTGGDPYTRFADHYGTNHRVTVVDITTRTLS